MAQPSQTLVIVLPQKYLHICPVRIYRIQSLLNLGQHTTDVASFLKNILQRGPLLQKIGFVDQDVMAESQFGCIAGFGVIFIALHPALCVTLCLNTTG